MRDNKSTEISAIEKQRIEQGDSELEDKKTKREKLKSDLQACKEQLKEIERVALNNPKDDTKCLKELDKLIKQAENDVAEASNTLNLLKKTKIIQAILSKAQEQAREKLRRYMSF